MLTTTVAYDYLLTHTFTNHTHIFFFQNTTHKEPDSVLLMLLEVVSCVLMLKRRDSRRDNTMVS